jgi:hypothetical protein
MKKKENSGIWSLRSLVSLSFLCLAQAAHAETALNNISLPGPMKLKILWVVAVVGLIFVISRKQKRLRNRL